MSEPPRAGEGGATIGEVVIRGKLCGLRDWRADDVGAYAYWQAPHHSWHDTNGPYHGRPSLDDGRQQAARLEAYVALPVERRPVPRESLAVVDPDDRMVGSVTWYWESRDTDWRRMGIALYNPAARSRGIGTEAMALWTTYLFDTTAARRLDFCTYSGNAAMCGVGRALGFVEEGRFREARPWEGDVYDAVVYGVLRVEWETRIPA
ncbi:MAG TPA: GNAT family protein [Micromonosporaceae bacterium]|nr:GNAT family protein [Micromonosporaceae bacterium]